MNETMEIIRKPIKGYEGLYEVDNLARVFSVDRVVTVNDNGRIYDKPLKGKKIKQAMHSKGYKVVALTKEGKMKSFFVHRLVAEAFIPNPNSLPMINHIDEDKTNNLSENLEWCDSSYNMMYGNARAKRMRTLKKNHPDWFCADGKLKEGVHE